MSVTHNFVVDNLTLEQRTELLRRSNYPGMLHLAGHWGCIITTALLIHWRVPIWQLLLPVQGIFIIFLFSLLHETIHRTPFKTRWINVVVSNVCGFLIVLGPIWFRSFHTNHHRYTNDPEKDPELLVKKPETRVEYLCYLSGIPVWYAQLRRLVVAAFETTQESFVAASLRPSVKREARCFLLGYTLIAFASWYLQTAVLLWIWLIPLVFGQPFLRAFLLAEHGGCSIVGNMLENTRTTFTNPVVRFLTWNMPYHAEHHTFPAVPFHNLRKLHQITKAHLQVTERGYFRFHWNFVKSLMYANPVT